MSLEKGAAVFYRIMCGEDKSPTYFVKATDDKAVHGFANSVDAIRYFEDAYFKAVARGYGWSAGAMLNFIQTQPRVFDFTMPMLKELLGTTIYPVSINATGVHEVAFKCKDQKLAAEIYAKASVPRLSPS